MWLARNMERFWDSWMDWGSAIFRRNWAALWKQKQKQYFPSAGLHISKSVPSQLKHTHPQICQGNCKVPANIKWQHNSLLFTACTGLSTSLYLLSSNFWIKEKENLADTARIFFLPQHHKSELFKQRLWTQQICVNILFHKRECKDFLGKQLEKKGESLL